MDNYSTSIPKRNLDMFVQMGQGEYFAEGEEKVNTFHTKWQYLFEELDIFFF